MTGVVEASQGGWRPECQKLRKEVQRRANVVGRAADPAYVQAAIPGEEQVQLRMARAHRLEECKQRRKGEVELQGPHMVGMEKDR